MDCTVLLSRAAAEGAPRTEAIPTHRKEFINAQWALGGAGSGAPVHFHNGAW